ncbi:MAG: type II toxin-antitoxin system YafQ family toxin [Planctomycetota bacterium]|jgi:mRNA interferase YafQ|nr:type II toxin-antitoxin system YafQ family toxin [Planctomycetota bacterium]
MKELHETARFRRDCRKIERGGSGKAQRNLAAAIELLMHDSALPPEFRDHGLSGNWAGFRDCHIGPDLLLIYKTTPTTVYLTRLGSHSELF